jgi:hypothetical protein
MTEPLKAAVKANRDYQRAASRSDELREKRNQAIKAAVQAGVSEADLARALNLTPGRINHLTK